MLRMIVSAAAIREAAAPDMIGKTQWMIIIPIRDGIGANQVSNLDAHRQEALERHIDVGNFDKGAGLGGGGARGLL